ncbi:glycosyltransferase family 2 protein [Lonepinella sp. BR2271]|uniref:glycosyltransferase family 2 protein n=1 Tax=Lonepinella sp. BR2271 TaxID=3434550 RepID=UPI003F6DDA23
MNFSVLLSLYIKEQPEFLQACLDSLFLQTLPATEIFLVYDGVVTSELENVVNQYSSKLPLKVVPLERNVGLGKALNAGLKHCSYDWILRMDTDDICTPDRFEKQIAFIQENPDVALFGGQIQEFNQSISENPVIKAVPTQENEIKKLAQKRNPFNHMTVAFKKDVILELGAYQHHLLMEDYNLWLRVIGAGYPVANLADILVYARVGNGMHARRRGWQYVKSEKQLFDLKRKLNIQPLLPALAIFLMRSCFRLLPSGLLGQFYNRVLRKNR